MTLFYIALACGNVFIFISGLPFFVPVIFSTWLYHFAFFFLMVFFIMVFIVK